MWILIQPLRFIVFRQLSFTVLLCLLHSMCRKKIVGMATIAVKHDCGLRAEANCQGALRHVRARHGRLAQLLPHPPRDLAAEPLHGGAVARVKHGDRDGGEPPAHCRAQQLSWMEPSSATCTTIPWQGSALFREGEQRRSLPLLVRCSHCVVRSVHVDPFFFFSAQFSTKRRCFSDTQLLVGEEGATHRGLH